MVLIFINLFVWFKEGHLNFPKKKGSSSQIFLWQIFHEFFPILIFGPEDFSSCVGSTQIIFGRFLQFLFIKKNSYKLWIYSSPFKKNFSCLDICWKLSSKPTSLLWVKPSIQFQQVSTSFRFYFYLFYPQTFFCNLFWTLGIYKGSTKSLKFLSSSKLP